MLTTNSHVVLAVLAGLLLATTVSAWDAAGCRPSGTLRPTESYPCQDCCKAGESYPTYRCSPLVAAFPGRTNAVMTLTNFEKGGDGGYPAQCDDEYHVNWQRVVVLPSGWYNAGARCNRNVRIFANGMSAVAEVVGECDSLNGCDREHAYRLPCRPNIIGASQAVWDALGITGADVGEYNVPWADA